MNQKILSKADKIINLLTSTEIKGENFLKFRNMVTCRLSDHVKANSVAFALKEKNEKGFKEILITEEKDGIFTVNFYKGYESLQKEDHHIGVHEWNLLDLILRKTRLVNEIKKCPECDSNSYGYQSIRRGDPVLTADLFDLVICRNCNFQPFSNIRGLI